MSAEIDATTESTRLKRDVKIFRIELIIIFQPFTPIHNVTSH